MFIRWLFRHPGEWRRARPWFLCAMVVVAMLLAWRFSWRSSPMGTREVLEQRTGLDLPFWPDELSAVDDSQGMVITRLRLTPAQLRQLPSGASIALADATMLLEATALLHRDEWRHVAANAELAHYTHCQLGWYAVVLVDRKSGRLWATLFYTDSSGHLPCSPS
jgi:hypothetical protein